MPHNRDELEKQLCAKAEAAIRTLLAALPDKAKLTMDDMEDLIGKMGQDFIDKFLSLGWVYGGRKR
ncbi:MAG: hypothetical protein H6672_06180 [Anaerolineaceae bacterium]|nr:hypothetical protein [Anaerolineaceae bacterium]